MEHGVTGVVANHIMKEFARPVVLLILEGDTAVGAARSPKGINIYEILKKLDKLYLKFGGHENACGMTIAKDKIPIFLQEIKKLEKETVISVPVISVDTEIKPEEINLDIAKEIRLLEPCGVENPCPIFLLKNVKVVNWKYIGSDGKYSKLEIELQQRNILESVCWDIPNIGDILKNFFYFDLVGQIEENKFAKNGFRFVVLDLKPVV